MAQTPIHSAAETNAAISAHKNGALATSAQGALADSAIQPGDLSTVATSGSYPDLINKPTLGTAAAAATGDFATAAQGTTADSALQPADVSAQGLTARSEPVNLSGGNEGDVLQVQSDDSLALGPVTIMITDIESSDVPNLSLATYPAATTTVTMSATQAGVMITTSEASGCDYVFPQTLVKGLSGSILREGGAGAITWSVTGAMAIELSSSSAGHTQSTTGANPSIIEWFVLETNVVVISGETEA